MTTREMHQKFWAQFNDYASHRPDFTREFNLKEWHSYTDRHAYDFHIGESGYHLVITLNTPENRINVGIYCDSLATYKEVYTIKPQIERDLGFELWWHQSDNRGNAYLRRIVHDICDESTWPELNEWCIHYLLQFKEVCQKNYQPYLLETKDQTDSKVQTIQSLLRGKNAEFDATKNIKLIRHSSNHVVKGYPFIGTVSELYYNDREGFLKYQQHQRKANFDNVDYIVSFIGEEGTKSRFIGVYKNFGRESDDPSDPIACYYNFEEVPGFEHLKERVIIEWNNPRAWQQWWCNNPMKVINRVEDYNLTEASIPSVIDNNSDSISDPNNLIPEGAKSRVTVNRYERNPEARQLCIKAKGCTCAVCGMNFEEVYGPIGKDFIHVHHVIPISEIGQSYEVNPVTDLVPVCPNCHAMLHHGKDGKVLKVEELKEILKENKKSSRFFGWIK